MFSKVIGAAVRGVSIHPIIVETDIGEGLPCVNMVGLLNSEVKEAKERVRTAIKNTGIFIPPKKITINLSPADLKKEGGSFDLPIAIGILISMGIVKSIYNIEDILFVGELSLEGTVNSVKGVLPITLSARDLGYKRVIVPKDNSKEGAVIEGIEVIGVKCLKEVIDILNGDKIIEPEYINLRKAMINNIFERKSSQDFSDVFGQEVLKRAALVAAAGRHNILIIGPPGSGKTMVASRISTILPAPNIDECIETTKIHSIAGELDGKTILLERPFRSPHHTITNRAMIGGGRSVRPGEVTLAHKGVLFLDELAEFKRETIDVLRQPIENKKVVISRVAGKYEFPADIMLVAATNPCKCGYYPDKRKCNCTEYEVKNYIGRISGPMLDRIDISVSAPTMSIEDMQSNKKNISSDEMRKKVEAARFIQSERYKNTKINYNSDLNSKSIKKYCYLGEKEKELIKKAFENIGISTRAYYKIIKVARTISDLDGSLNITEKHIAEAIAYKSL